MSKERELLQRALYLLECVCTTPLLGQIKELLAQPEHKEEPVAWMYERQSESFIERTLSVGFEKNFDGITIPLYTSPPLIRKPLSGKEISHGFRSNKDATNAESYWAGVEYAEKFHGIGVDDETM